MQIDSAELRRHYATLCDEELLAIHRADLTAAAQKAYDLEVGKRHLMIEPESAAEPVREMPPLEFDPGAGDEWEGESAVATAFVVHPRELAATPTAENAARTCEALRAAGIPCNLHNERESDGKVSIEVMIPAGQVLNARAVLDKEIYNPLFEAEWRTHFETLTDEEFGGLDLGLMRAGINDRVERLERVYRNEVARRQTEPRP